MNYPRKLFFENGSRFGLSQNDVKYERPYRNHSVVCRSLERDMYSIKSKREVHFTAIRLA